jgi:photosystem I P700 chlorophyll a apoprotein A1
MIIRSSEPEVKIVVDMDPIKTSFEEWARPSPRERRRQRACGTPLFVSGLLKISGIIPTI